MSTDNYPLDREHWLIAVNLPVALMPRMDELLGKIEELAGTRGGRANGRSNPTADFAGRPGYTTFGTSIAFEAGDVNADAFIRRVKDLMHEHGVTVEHDPEMIFSPAEPDEDSDSDFRP
jgi:hypothetical protein